MFHKKTGFVAKSAWEISSKEDEVGRRRRREGSAGTRSRNHAEGGCKQAKAQGSGCLADAVGRAGV